MTATQGETIIGLLITIIGLLIMIRISVAIKHGGKN